MLQAILILFHGSDWKLIQCKLDVSGWMSYRNKSFKMCIHCWCYTHKDTYARNHEPIKNNIHVIIRMVMVFRFQCPGSGGKDYSTVNIRSWVLNPSVGKMAGQLKIGVAIWKPSNGMEPSMCIEMEKSRFKRFNNFLHRSLATMHKIPNQPILTSMTSRKKPTLSPNVRK